MSDEKKPAFDFDALRAKHGRIRYCEGEGDTPGGVGWAVVLTVPNVAGLKQYKHELHDPTLRADAQANIFRKMVVAAWTEWDGECDVAKLLERVGLAPEGCSDAVSALTGLAASQRAKA